MKTAAALAVLAIAASASAQQPIRIRKPDERTHVRATNFDVDPASAEEVDLATLANDIGSYDKRHVRTRGRLEHVVSADRDLSEYYYILSAGFARVTIVPGYGVLREDLDEMVSQRSDVKVRGIVRMLGNPMSTRENPELPPLPRAGAELPRVSITLLAISRGASKEIDLDDGSPLTRQILRDPARFAGKPIRIVGQFRGRNLFDDLPGESKRSAADWVLREGTHALWVVGRAPKGHGFSLDVEAKGDSARWLEVEGKPEVVEGVVYLRASKVTLAPRRKEQQ